MVTRREVLIYGGLATAFAADGARQILRPWRSHPLPGFLTWATNDPGTIPYVNGAWVANAFKDSYDTILHLKYTSGEVNVLRLLVQNLADHAVVGLAGSYFAQEGLFEFEQFDQGPQPVRLLLENTAPYLRTLIMPPERPNKQLDSALINDLAWLNRQPQVNYLSLSLARASGWDFGSSMLTRYKTLDDAIEAAIRGNVGAALSTSREISRFDPAAAPDCYSQLDAQSPGWPRIKEWAPFYRPTRGSLGVGLSKAQAVEGTGYPMPLLVALPDADIDVCAAVVDALIDVSPRLATQSAAAAYWQPEGLSTDFFVPYHEGAIRALTGRGLWTDLHQQRNDRLIARQEVLARAWNEWLKLLQSESHVRWYEYREQTLLQAEHEPGFVPALLTPYLDFFPVS